MHPISSRARLAGIDWFPYVTDHKDSWTPACLERGGRSTHWPRRRRADFRTRCAQFRRLWPEAALTVLLALDAAGLTFILPITLAIVILLGIVYVSYRQTIAAYPNGSCLPSAHFWPSPCRRAAWSSKRRIFLRSWA